MRELTIVTENRVGALADVCEALGHVGVNVSSISAHGYANKGIIRLVTSDEITAKKTLEKIGMNVVLGDLLIVKIPDRPGEIGKLTRKLSDFNINIEGIYLLGRSNSRLEMAIKPDDIQKASQAIKR
ncbi:MAG: hypothetical protein ABIG39_02260 [Candidatus Micrarchaeota archaeon]